MYIYIVILFFTFLLLRCRFKGYWLPAYFVVGLYLVSLIASLGVYLNAPEGQIELSLVPSFLFCFLLTVSFSPFFQRNPQRIIDNSNAFKKRFILSGSIISIFLLIASLFLLTKVREALLLGVVDVRIDMYKGNEALSSYTRLEHIGHSAIRWLGGLVYCLLLMFFYALAFIPKKWWFKILLIVSSLSYAYFGMLNGGRTHIMYWVIFFLFSLSLFYKYIPKKEKRRAFTIVGLPLFFVIALYLISVSIGRADAARMDTDSMVIEYMGKPYINFCHYFDNINYHPYTLIRIFPLTSSLCGVNTDLSDYRDFLESKSGMDIGTFFTFLGDIYIDIGIVGLLLFVFIVFGFLANRYCKKKVVSFSNILIIGIFARLVLHGLFYYSFYQREVSVSLIFTIILAYYLRPNIKYSFLIK